jgi:hypothetical protein
MMREKCICEIVGAPLGVYPVGACPFGGLIPVSRHGIAFTRSL